MTTAFSAVQDCPSSCYYDTAINCTHFSFVYSSVTTGTCYKIQAKNPQTILPVYATNTQCGFVPNRQSRKTYIFQWLKPINLLLIHFFVIKWKACDTSFNTTYAVQRFASTCNTGVPYISGWSVDSNQYVNPQNVPVTAWRHDSCYFTAQGSGGLEITGPFQNLSQCTTLCSQQSGCTNYYFDAVNQLCNLIINANPINIGAIVSAD